MSDDPHGAGLVLLSHMVLISVLIGGACIYGIAWVIGVVDAGATIKHRRDEHEERL